MASFHDFTVNTLDGKPFALSQLKGKVALVVNTASACGFTPQYEGLEALHEELAAQGLVVMGFPSNEFGGQEPGTASEIAQFCTTKFGVKFPMFEKVHTKGKEQAPVYAFLTAKEAAPKWNFYKYLVGKDGQVVASFSSMTAPSAKDLREAIQKALKA